MAHSDGEPFNEKTLRTFFSPTVLPSSVTSDTSPLQNKLLAYRRCNEQQKMLNQLLIDRALKAYRISMEEKEHRDPPPSIPELPSTMNSEKRQRRTNYLFMKSRVLSNPMVPIQQQWLMSLLSLVPQSLMEGKNEKLLTEQLLGEIIKDYEMSMRRFMVRRVLIKPDIDGLEDEEAPLPSLPLGLDFSTPWCKSFIQAKNQILSNLHIVHPTMRTLLDFGSSAFSDFLVVDFSSFRLQKPINCENLKAYVSSRCSQAEEKILNTWYKKVLSLFSEKEALGGVKSDQVDSFFNCVATLMSNQLKELLGRTVEAFVKHFVPEDGNCLPLFKMELTLDENIMEFYPSLPDFEEAILFVVNRVGQTLQDVQTVHSWLMGGTATLDAELPSHVRAWATSTLRNCIRDNLEGPKKYFESYVERYGWLVDGTAQARIERFEKEEQRSFDEYADFIDEFFTLKKEILSLPQGADFPMICLSCEDLKEGLANKANTFANMLLDKILQDYREENAKICREFEAMKERALKVPETTEEMMETVAYMEKFKTEGIQDLSSRIKECCQQMNYFLDVCLFSSEDIALNAAVVLWPSRINSILEEHDILFARSKSQKEQELIHKCEKLMVELDKLARSVAEFEDYSELDCIQEYVADLRGLQKRIQEADETVALINKQEALLRWKPSDYPLLSNLKTEIEPYQKLFLLILRWQRTEKRWMDEVCSEQDVENMEAEVDEFFSEMDKALRLFQQKQKKVQQEGKKTPKSRAVGEKTEETEANPTVKMCSSVLEQIKDFKDFKVMQLREKVQKLKDVFFRPMLLKDISSAYMFGEDSDDEIPTQQAIQESLQDRHKIETRGSATEDESFQYITSKEHGKIIAAIRTGREEALMKLVRHSSAFEEADQQGWLPVHEAAAQLNRNILEITLRASPAATWEQTTLKGETPLLVAVENCLVDNVCFLLHSGCNPNVKNEEGDSPLVIAIKHDSYEIASLLVSSGAKVNLQCVHKRTALHEAAKLGRKGLVKLLLRSGADPDPRSGYGLTPLALAAQGGHTEVMELLLQKGADVLSQAMDCASVLFEAAGGGNPDSLNLLLEYGADANVPKHSGHLPIHRAAYRGHFLALKSLVPVTDFDAIKESGISPVHSAAAGAHPQCLEFLLKSGFDANFMLDQRVRKGYDDHRKSALYFAVSNGDVCSAQLLLNAGALPNQDPINCLQIALRMGNYELVNLLLRHGANVNYFCRVNTTHFPSALQYALKDEVMLRMLMGYGYDVHRCFDCPWGNSSHSHYGTDGWTSTVIKDTMFCEVITLSWLKHLSGKVVRVMLDYVDHVNICWKLAAVLREQELWPDINSILTNPRSLKHLCRLKIRECMGRLRLRCPVFMTFLPLPNCLKDYILYKEYDLYGQENFTGTYSLNST